MLNSWPWNCLRAKLNCKTHIKTSLSDLLYWGNNDQKIPSLKGFPTSPTPKKSKVLKPPDDTHNCRLKPPFKQTPWRTPQEALWEPLLYPQEVILVLRARTHHLKDNFRLNPPKAHHRQEFLRKFCPCFYKDKLISIMNFSQISRAKGMLQKSLFSYLPQRSQNIQGKNKGSSDFVNSALSKTRQDLDDIWWRFKLSLEEAWLEKPIITPIFGWFRK